jgi:hypothetical protein
MYEYYIHYNVKAKLQISRMTEKRHNELHDVFEAYTIKNVFNLPKDFDPNPITTNVTSGKGETSTPNEEEDKLHREIIELREKIRLVRRNFTFSTNV